jgi:hypothetical protein
MSDNHVALSISLYQFMKRRRESEMPNLYNTRLLMIQKKAFENGLDSLTDDERHLLSTQRIVQRGVGPLVVLVKTKDECHMNKRCLEFGGSWDKGDDEEDEGPTYPRNNY